MNEKLKPKPENTQTGSWGHLPEEPCRFCHMKGFVFFLIDEGPEGKIGLSPTRCDKCGRSWIPGETSA